MTDRHVKRFVFGRLLPIRGVENVWERRYGWHWVVERNAFAFGGHSGWNKEEWMNKRGYKDGGLLFELPVMAGDIAKDRLNELNIGDWVAIKEQEAWRKTWGLTVGTKGVVQKKGKGLVSVWFVMSNEF